MALTKEGKENITIVVVLAAMFAMTIVVAKFSTIADGIGRLIGETISLIGQWWPAIALAAIPVVSVLFWLMMFAIALGGLWVVVRVVRHAWRS